MKEKLKKSKLFFLLSALPAFLLLFFAVKLRLKGSPLFCQIETTAFNAPNLTSDVAYITPFLWNLFKNFKKNYLANYVVPVYLCLLPSILFNKKI